MKSLLVILTSLFLFWGCKSEEEKRFDAEQKIINDQITKIDLNPIDKKTYCEAKERISSQAKLV